jgi:membrane protease YdiL (CAAX protease family)
MTYHDSEPAAAPAIGDGDYLPGTRWRLWHAAVVMVVFLLSAIVGIVIVSLVTGTDVDELTANQQLGVLGPVQFLGGILGLVVIMQMVGERSPVRAFGLELKARDWWAYFVGMALQIGSAIMLLVLALLLFPDAEPPRQSAAEVTSELTGWGIAVGFLTLSILAPIYEEALFRGVVLSRLVRLMSDWPAYLLNGLLFAAIHVVFDPEAWFASIALFPLGTALAWMAHRSGDLSRSILAHMGVNSLAAVVLFFGDDLERWAEELEQSAQAVIRFVGLG